jgi:hypothetical protein
VTPNQFPSRDEWIAKASEDVPEQLVTESALAYLQRDSAKLVGDLKHLRRTLTRVIRSFERGSARALEVGSLGERFSYWSNEFVAVFERYQNQNEEARRGAIVHARERRSTDAAWQEELQRRERAVLIAEPVRPARP